MSFGGGLMKLVQLANPPKNGPTLDPIWQDYLGARDAGTLKRQAMLDISSGLLPHEKK